MSKNNKFRVQDDLYEFVNYNVWNKRIIPKDKSSVSAFGDKSVAIEKTLIKDFNNFLENKNLIENEELKKAVQLYEMALNNKRDKKEAIKDLLPSLKVIEELKDINDFNQNFLYFYDNLYALPFNFYVSIDMKLATKYSLDLNGPGIILPDTTYYKKGNKEKDKLLKVWKDMTFKILSLIPNLNKEKINILINQTLEFDELIAAIVKSSEEWADYVKSYNPTDFQEVSKLLEPIDFEKIIKRVYQKIPETINVNDPRFLKEFKTLFNENTFHLYKSWMYVNEVLGSVGLLCHQLRRLSDQYDLALSGAKASPSIRKWSYRLAAFTFMYEPVGMYYGKKYFGQQAKKEVYQMVVDLIDAYKQRLNENEWLSKETKQKAILKLNTLEIKVGYPNQLSKRYKNVKFDFSGSLFDSIIAMQKSLQKYDDSLLYQPVDRAIWHMTAHTVNACYDSSFNDITFPAGILQKPFYSLKQNYAQNLGGIGTVIGHEISHAFDNNGAQFDELGNLNNWWTKNDYSKFKQKTKLMIDQFDGLLVSSGKVNGKLVVSENIADLAGIAVALQTLENKPVSTKAYKDFFITYAKTNAEKMRPEHEKLLLAVDVHAPSYWRTNKPVQNFEQFYTTFKVKESDKMFLEKSKRIKIW